MAENYKDIDLLETKEWIESIEDTLEEHGYERTRFLLETLIDYAQSKDFAQQIIDKWSLTKVKHAKGKGAEFVGCSVGYYYETANVNTTITDLIKKADDALYRAKNNGRACAVLY